MARLGDKGTLAAAMAVLLRDDVDEPRSAAAESELPPDLRQDLERFEAGAHDLRPSSWWTIASALAHAAFDAQSPSSRRVADASERLRGAPPWAHDVFDSSCMDIVRVMPDPIRNEWLTELGSPPELSAPSPPPTSEVVAVYTAGRQWLLTDVFDLWSHENELNIGVHLMAGHSPTRMLRRHDARRWFQAVDTWLDPRLVSASLSSDDIVLDRDAILECIATAGVVFDEAGQWTGRTSIVRLVTLVVQHGARLLVDIASGAPRGLGDADERRAAAVAARDNELPLFFRAAWDTLLDRADGLAIAAALHAHLCIRLQHPGRTGPSDPIPVARRALAAALAARAVRPAELESLWRARHVTAMLPGARTTAGHASGVHAVETAVEVIEQGGPSAVGLRELITSRLLDADPGWGEVARAGELLPLLSRIVDVLSPAPDALRQLERLYVDLEPMRRATEVAPGYPGNNSDLPSIVALFLLVAVSAACRADMDQSNAVLGRSLAAATRLVLTSSTDAAFPARDAFAFAIRTCAAVGACSVSDALGVAVTDPSLAAVAVASLLNVLPRLSVETMLAHFGLSLASLRAGAKEWSDATKRPSDASALMVLEAALEETPPTRAPSAAPVPTH